MASNEPFDSRINRRKNEQVNLVFLLYIVVFSSEEDSKIDLLDSPDIVSRKIMSAYCPREADNGVLSFINYVLMPIAHKVTLNNKYAYKLLLIINFREYTTFESVKEDFLAGRLDEKHLKQKLSDFAIDLLTKVIFGFLL